MFKTFLIFFSIVMESYFSCSFWFPIEKGITDSVSLTKTILINYLVLLKRNYDTYRNQPIQDNASYLTYFQWIFTLGRWQNIHSWTLNYRTYALAHRLLRLTSPPIISRRKIKMDKPMNSTSSMVVWLPTTRYVCLT